MGATGGKRQTQHHDLLIFPGESLDCTGKLNCEEVSMPIYEFYCRKCNTVYNFFSKTVNTDKIPFCPNCKRVKLKRQMSIFARVSRGKEEPAHDDMPPFDEGKMEKAMAMLAGEADKIKEDDPRQAACEGGLARARVPGDERQLAGPEAGAEVTQEIALTCAHGDAVGLKHGPQFTAPGAGSFGP